MKQTVVTKILLLMSMMILSSCSLFTPVKLEPESAYMLNAVPHPYVQHSPRPLTLLVAMPETSPAYNTTQMAYTVRPYQIAYFGKNRWAETPSHMLQPLLVQTLQNTGYFRAIVTPPFTGSYHYVLNSQILQLQQNFTETPAVLQFMVRFQITDMNTNQIIATKQITIRQPILQRTPYGGVLAANRAMQKMLDRLAHFCMSNIH